MFKSAGPSTLNTDSTVHFNRRTLRHAKICHCILLPKALPNSRTTYNEHSSSSNSSGRDVEIALLRADLDSNLID